LKLIYINIIKNISQYKFFNQALILAGVWAISFLAMTSVRSVLFANQPPVWDSLIYQNEALTVFHSWIQGEKRDVLNAIITSRNPLFTMLLFFGYVFFGLNEISPYLISSLFGLGFIFATFLLSCELGSSKNFALLGSILWAVSPNYLYQNFFQSRNDYALACFLGISWLLFIKSAKLNDLLLAFFGGVVGGLGVLLKASAPGYLIFGPLLFIILSKQHVFLDFRNRCRLVLCFALGAGLVSGWHYLPNLHEHLSYYGTWAKEASQWKLIQYGLESDWTNYFFYFKNLLNVHLEKWPKILLAGVLSLLGIRLISKRFLRNKKEKSPQNIWIGITLGAAIIPLVFLSWKQSFSSAGDTPLLSLLVAAVLAFLSRDIRATAIPKYFISPVIFLGLGVSTSQMPILETRYRATDFDIFCSEIGKTREKYWLKNTPMLQVFSHPVYNIDSYRWKTFMCAQSLNTLPKAFGEIQSILFPENPATIAAKLSIFPIIILSELSGSVIDGESFHTFNRLHQEINHELKNLNNFVKIKRLDLENQKFPVYLAINRDLVRFLPEQETEDGWVEWGSAVNLFALEPSQLIWSGLPIRPVQGFRLEKENGHAAINFHLEKIDPKGVYTYRSGWVPGSAEPRAFILRPLAGELVPVASKEDSRPLAFRKVKTAADRAGTDEKSGK